jgi:hypothetical protein
LVGTGPAHASEVDKSIGYRCSSAFGSGSSAVRIRVSIPDLAFQGVKVAARRIRFSIKVPTDMVRLLRQSGADSVSAAGEAHFTVGTLKRRIRHLHVPETSVPRRGGMILKGSGRASAFAINQPGTYLVKVTRSLTATATVHGGIGVEPVDLTCSVRRGQSRTLASLEVIR